jgi:hypothetical protein
MLLHPDRCAPGAPTRKNGVVIHDSEGVEGGTASASLIRALQAKGDRPTSSGGVYGAGYQAIATETGGYIIVADDNVGPYHAGSGINPCMWSICIPGKASQTRSQWLGDVSREYIRGAARYIVDMWNHDGHVWPLEYRTGAQLAADKANLRDHPTGYTSHFEVRESKLTSTDHYDPGPNFPWDVLAADIAALTQHGPPATTPPVVEKPTAPTTPTIPPLEDIDMANIGIIHLDDADAVFVGTFVGPIAGPRFLDVHWVRDTATSALAAEHAAAGATVFGGDKPTAGAARLVKANLKNCFVDVVPVGDSRTTWASPRDIVLARS